MIKIKKLLILIIGMVLFSSFINSSFLKTIVLDDFDDNSINTTLWTIGSSLTFYKEENSIIQLGNMTSKTSSDISFTSIFNFTVPYLYSINFSNLSFTSNGDSILFPYLMNESNLKVFGFKMDVFPCSTSIDIDLVFYYNEAEKILNGTYAIIDDGCFEHVNWVKGEYAISDGQFLISGEEQLRMFIEGAGSNQGFMTLDKIEYITYQDNEVPLFYNNKTNFSENIISANDNAQFSIKITDDWNLDRIIFERKNDSSSSWENITFDIWGNNINFTYNMSMSSTRDQTFQYRWTINDTSGNMNGTDIFYVTMGDASPIWTTTIADDTINEDSGLNNHEDITGYCTDADSDTVGYTVQTEDTNKVDIDVTVAELITETPFPNWNGTTDVTIRCCSLDPVVCVDDTYTITVIGVNDYMLWSNNRTNFTQIKFNQYGQFNVTAEDEDEIAGCLFSYNNASNGWINDTWVAKNVNKTDLINISLMTATYGEYFEWRYYCNDTEGIMYNSSINSIMINDTSPTLTQSLTNQELFHNQNLVYQVNYSDIDGDTGATFKVNTTLVSINSSGFITDNPSQSENGTYHIQVDISLNLTNLTTSFDYTIKNSNPYYITFSPANLTTIGNNYTNLTVNANDSESDSITYEFYNGTSPNNLNLVYSGTNHSFNLTLLNDTTYYWQVNISDGLDSNLSDIYRFTVNTVSPAINPIHPESEQYLNYNLTRFNFTFYDATGADTLLLYHNINGSFVKNETLRNPVNDASTENNFSYASIPDGNYIFGGWGNDTEGNSGFSINHTFTIDTIYPHVKITAPEEGYGTTSTTLTFTYEISDTNLNLATQKYSILYRDNNQVYTTNTTLTNQTSFIADASARGYILWIFASDKALNSNSSSVNFTVSTPTTITLEGGGGGGYVPPLTVAEVIKELPSICGDGICADDEFPHTCIEDCPLDIFEAIKSGRAWVVTYGTVFLGGWLFYASFKRKKRK